MRKSCYNCKYCITQMYSKNLCSHTFYFEDNGYGIIKKEYPLAKDVRIDDEECKFYKHSWIMKLRLKFNSWQVWWYKKRFPERLV